MSSATLTGPKYSLVIPAHNEEARIGPTLTRYAEVFSDSEVIVVLNGCTDLTKDVVIGVKRLYQNLRLLEIPDPVGKGGAVRAGILVSRASVVGYVDADGSTPAEEMRRLFESLGESDCVIASRWLPASRIAVPQPFRRRIASRCFNAAVKLLFHLPFRDTQCGAKVFRKTALDEVLGEVETSNLAFDVDMLFQLKERGFVVHEEPTHWVDAAGSRVHLAKSSLRMLAALMRLRLRHSFFRLIVPVFDRMFPTKPMRTHGRLRILILNWRDITHPQAGGAEAYLFEQAKRWVALGHHVQWLTSKYPGASDTDEIEGVLIRRAGGTITQYLVLPLVYLREFRDRFDVVIDSENGIPFFTPLYSLKPKICMVYHVHQKVFKKHLPAFLAYPLMWCEAKLVPFLYRRAHFVTISEDTRREMERLRIGRRSIGLVHCGVDTDLKPGERSAQPSLLYLGRLKPYKRVDLLIEAFSRVREQIPEAILRIAGTGDARPGLERQVQALGLTDAVVFEGFVSAKRKAELLREAWVFVSPSEMEGWGISVIEANASATPAVAFEVPGLGEAIIQGQNGLLVPDGGDLAVPITMILRDADLRARLEHGALERAQAFSWDNSATRMLEEIMRALVGSEVRTIELDDRWAFVGAGGGAKAKSAPSAFAFGAFSLYQRNRLHLESSSKYVSDRTAADVEFGGAGGS